MIQRAAVKWKRKRILFFPVLDPAEEQSGFEMRNTWGEVAGHDPWIGGRGCAPECRLRVQAYCCEIIFWSLDLQPPSHPPILPPRQNLQPPSQRKLFQHALLGQPRSTYCREPQRCEMGWGDISGLGGYFWAAPGGYFWARPGKKWLSSRGG